ncbi:hypothetical protein ABZT34_34835 [Streptomyces sp. NPDC005329]|uniref:hypothetical protein n=1 Tax=Streptomyces sp. NPDC005329 TaxID=3157034 RepID=UPI0033B93558
MNYTSARYGAWPYAPMWTRRQLERRGEVVVLEATSDYWRHLCCTQQVPSRDAAGVRGVRLLGDLDGTSVIPPEKTLWGARPWTGHRALDHLRHPTNRAPTDHRRRQVQPAGQFVRQSSAGRVNRRLRKVFVEADGSPVRRSRPT